MSTFYFIGKPGKTEPDFCLVEYLQKQRQAEFFQMAIEKRRAVKAMEDEVNEWMTHMREKISVTALDQLNHPLAYEQLPRVDDIVRPPQCR